MSATGPPASLVREARIAALVAGLVPELRRFEASGVALEHGLLWVVFDNLPDLVAVDPALRPGEGGVVVVRRPGPAAGYEDVAVDRARGRRFVLVEGAQAPDGRLRSRVDELDAAWRRVASSWIQVPLERPNKGLEGLDWVERDGTGYLLALSEGNGGHGGRRGRRPGGGLVHVLAESATGWTAVDVVRLPPEVRFRDYSAVAVREGRIAVASQESSAVWVGRLDPSRWRVTGPGRVHPLPRDRRGRVRYGAVEGLVWLDDDLLAAVSDRAGRRRPRRVRRTGESIHVFALPGPGSGS